MTPEWVFRPRLPGRARAALVGAGVLLAAGMLIALGDPDERLVGVAAATAFGLIVRGLLLHVPREIVFGDAITIRRHVLPDKRIEYRDITGLGLGKLVARNGGLEWGHFDNDHEVEEALDRLIEAGVIPTERFGESAFASDLAEVDALKAALLISLALGLGFVALLHLGVALPVWLVGNVEWVLLAAFGALYGAASLIYRTRWRRRLSGPAA